MISEEYRGAKQWSRDKQAVFTVVWISFLSAAIGTMVFFALFDPVDLSGIFDDDLDIGRDAGYAAGFFFFWVTVRTLLRRHGLPRSDRTEAGRQAPRAMNKPQSASMYESAKKIYPREIGGRFANLSKLATIILLGLFYAVPWLNWDERQAVLFDLPARKFHLLGLTLWPQDFPYLAMLLIIAALSLFFFTALAGRLWCGFACPQTVWTEVFIWMEQWTEGTRSQRMKLDKAPWSWNKLRRKGSKQFLWITFSMWTGFTFVGYFTPVRELGAELIALDVGGWTLFWGLFYGFATYGNAGYMREQVCKYMCPYARFQSAMFDKDTLIISYDEERGEPRGGRKRSVDHKEAGLGDCIDCQLCVQVCPTGIDIREGPAIRVHCLRRMYRRLRFDHGQDGLPARPGSLHD